MIYTERVISVKGGTASIDAPIVLYRGDRNIEIVFEIINSKFKFSEKGNYILDIGAKYGQLAVDMPDGTDLFTDIAKCMDGKVIFKITGDMINEIAENGFYSFHVRLFNDDKTSRVTIPPIMEGIEIREPIVIEGDAIFPIVDMGGVDIAPIDSDEETFIDENGKLDIRWVTGDIISSTRLNQMVEYINENTYSRDEFELDKYVDKEYLDAKVEFMDIELDKFDAELINTKSLLESTRDDINSIIYDYANREYVDEKNNEVVGKLDVVESELDELQADLDYMSDRLNEYATEEYVDAKESSLNLRIDGTNQEIESVRQIAESNDFTDEINGVTDEINSTNELVADHELRITNIQTDLWAIQDKMNSGSDGSGHATEEYVDNRVNTLRQDMNDLCDGIYLDMDSYKEEVKQECNTYTDELYENISNSFGDYYTVEYIDEQFGNQNETLGDHNTRIETLETAIVDIPDITGYATIEYVDGNVASMRGTLTTHYEYISDNTASISQLNNRVTALENLEGGSTIGVSKEYVDQKDNELRVILSEHYTKIEENNLDVINIEKQLGNINAILDAINGEVI